MPKLKENQVPSYRLHKHSGQAIVTLSGKDHLLGEYGSDASREKYDRLIGEWLANGRRGDYRNAGGVTVSRVIAEFWAHAKRYYAGPGGVRGSEADNFRVALIPLRRLYGATVAAEFGPRALLALQQEMVRLGWARTYINRQIARVKQVFKWAVAQELIPSGVYHGLVAVGGLRKGKSEAREAAPVRPVPESSVYPIKDHVSRQVWAMVELQLLTGLRSGEVVIMRGCDLDTGGGVWTYRPHRYKTQHHGLPREARIGPKAQEIIKQFWITNRQAFLFSPAEAERERREARSASRKTPATYGNGVGTNRVDLPERRPQDRYTVASYRKAIARACDVAFPPPPELSRQRVTIPGRHGRSVKRNGVPDSVRRNGLNCRNGRRNTAGTPTSSGTPPPLACAVSLASKQLG